MKPAEFRSERQRYWVELLSLVERIERRGIKSLSIREVRRLGGLYRSAVSSYMVLKGRTLDRKLVLFLRNLVTRAYIAVYHIDSGLDLRPARFFLVSWPATVRRHATAFGGALLLFLATLFASWYQTVRNPSLADVLIPAQMAGGRRSDSSASELQEVLVSGRDLRGGGKSLFAAVLFKHNTEVGFLSFALGVAAGIPALVLDAYQGVILGSMAGLYEARGLGPPFWAWVLPHGVTEVLAILLCVTAGLVVGGSILRPGHLRRLDALVAAGQEGGRIVLGSIPMFLLAAIIESFVRQTSLPDGARYLIACVSLAGWLLFFTLAGRSGNAPGEEKAALAPPM